MPSINDVRNKINIAIRNAVGTGEIVPVAHANVLDDQTNNNGVLQYVDARTKRETGVITTLGGEPGWNYTGAPGRYTLLDFGANNKIVHLKWVLTRENAALNTRELIATTGIPSAIRPTGVTFLPVAVNMPRAGNPTRIFNSVLELHPDGAMFINFQSFTIGSVTSTISSYTVHINTSYIL